MSSALLCHICAGASEIVWHAQHSKTLALTSLCTRFSETRTTKKCITVVYSIRRARRPISIGNYCPPGRTIPGGHNNDITTVSTRVKVIVDPTPCNFIVARTERIPTTELGQVRRLGPRSWS